MQHRALIGLVTVLLLSLSAACNSGTGDQAQAPEPPLETLEASMFSGPAEITVKGAGSTFIYPAMRRWTRLYFRATGVEIAYEPVGSGRGIERLEEKSVLFAASDKPLSKEELDSKGLVQWPVIAGGIVPVVNLLVEPGQLVLDGETLAEIYMGKITRWDHPRIQQLNEEIEFPASPITVVNRGDASGTTFNFADYLAKTSEEWRQNVGVSTDPAWPVGIPGLGNSGVAEFVNSIPNPIGFVNYAFALQTNLIYAKMANQAGNVVSPSMAAFEAAAENADYVNSPAFNVMLTGQTGENVWPIVATTFVLTRKNPINRKEIEAALGFFDWCYRNGEPIASELSYVPIPQTVWRLVEDRWSKQIRVSGQPVWESE